MVAWLMAMCNRKLSRFPFLRLLVLGNLLKNASRLVGCLTLLEEGDHSEWVSRHRLVQIGKLVLVHLGLCKEDLFTLLLCHRYVHCLTEVTIIEVAEKLHLMPRELVHRHESRLLRVTEPANQLVAYVRESGNGLQIIPIHSSKFAFMQSALFGHCFTMTLVHSVRPTPWKHWPIRLNSNRPSSFCASESWVEIFDLKLGSVYARKYSMPNQAWSGATWLVISLEVESLELF